MRRRATAYIKKQPFQNTTDSQEDSVSSQKNDSPQIQPQNSSLNNEAQKNDPDKSLITENSENSSSSDSGDEKDSKLQPMPSNRNSENLAQLHRQSSVPNRPTPLALFKSLSLTGSAPRLDRSASFLGKPRKSIFEPSTLNKLKTIKLETLKPDDQIELAILILQKEFEDRNQTDLAFLIKCTENVGFFKKYDEETHRNCMAKMYHVHLKQGDACINFGEFGENFWVTLKGKVGILVPIEKEITDKNGEVRKEKVLTRVAGQGAGYAFGELALLERKPRAATIVCEDDCDFAVLDKTPFQQILRIDRHSRSSALKDL